jgi:hypothetical protein
MNGIRVVPTGWEVVAILLGKFSAWMGAVMAPLYGVAFVIGLTQSGLGRTAVVTLSTLPPEVGLVLAVVSWMMAVVGHRPISTSAAVGVVLNASALTLAAVMPMLG